MLGQFQDAKEGFIWLETILELDLQSYETDNSVFHLPIDVGYTFLLVYVDKIVSIWNDSNGIAKSKQFLQARVIPKDLDKLRYFHD